MTLCKCTNYTILIVNHVTKSDDSAKTRRPKPGRSIADAARTSVISLSQKKEVQMFVLKGLGRMIWGDPNNAEIIQINAGQLFLVRPRNSLKGTSECM
jgi:VID27 N-terminal region